MNGSVMSRLERASESAEVTIKHLPKATPPWSCSIYPKNARDPLYGVGRSLEEAVERALEGKPEPPQGEPEGEPEADDAEKEPEPVVGEMESGFAAEEAQGTVRPASPDAVTVLFVRERPTPRRVRFRQVDDSPEAEIVGLLYPLKASKRFANARRLRATIEPDN